MKLHLIHEMTWCTKLIHVSYLWPICKIQMITDTRQYLPYHLAQLIAIDYVQ